MNNYTINVAIVSKRNIPCTIKFKETLHLVVFPVALHIYSGTYRVKNPMYSVLSSKHTSINVAAKTFYIIWNTCTYRKIITSELFMLHH